MKKRRGIFPTAATAADKQEDRISNLPDVVIHDILSRLPSSKQPAKLAILSKRWAHLWRSYPIIDIDSREWTTTGMKEQLNKFLAAIRVKYSDIQHVTAVRITLEDSNLYEHVVNELLRFLEKVTTIHEISINCTNDFCGPIIIFKVLFNKDCFRHLKVFELRNCMLSTSCSSSVSFGAFLRILSLKKVSFPRREDGSRVGDGILNNMIQAASCTLQSLTLSDLDSIERLQLQDLPNLKTLDTRGLHCRDFEINGALPLDILHVSLYYWREGGLRISLVPNKVRVLHISGTREMNNKKLNRFISNFPYVESLKLIDLPLIPRVKINVDNHKLRVIHVNFQNYLLSDFLKVIEIERAACKPAIRVSVHRRIVKHIDWHELKLFLSKLSGFHLTLELEQCYKRKLTYTTSYEDEALVPVIEHLKLPLSFLSLCDDTYNFIINLIFHCRPKILSFTETEDEVPKEYISQLKSYWFLILISVAAVALLKSLLLTLSSAGKARLPPGPASYPVIGNLIWLRRSLSEIEIILRNLHSKMGPTVTLRFGPRLAVFVADRNLAHQALIHNGAVFADRPPPPPLSRITSSNQQNISSSFYGPTWRLLRRNLTSEILHPSRVECYSHARRWVLQVIKARLVESAASVKPVQVLLQLLRRTPPISQIPKQQPRLASDLRRRGVLLENRKIG